MDTSATLPLESVSILLFSFLLMGYIVFCLVFHYHWQAYSVNAEVTKTTYLTFFATSLPLVIVGAIAVFFL